MFMCSYLRTHTCLVLTHSMGLQAAARGHVRKLCKYEGWNFNSGNYLFTTDTK